MRRRPVLLYLWCLGWLALGIAIALLRPLPVY